MTDKEYFLKLIANVLKIYNDGETTAMSRYMDVTLRECREDMITFDRHKGTFRFQQSQDIHSVPHLIGELMWMNDLVDKKLQVQ